MHAAIAFVFETIYYCWMIPLISLYRERGRKFMKLVMIWRLKMILKHEKTMHIDAQLIEVLNKWQLPSTHLKNKFKKSFKITYVFLWLTFILGLILIKHMTHQSSATFGYYVGVVSLISLRLWLYQFVHFVLVINQNY